METKEKELERMVETFLQRAVEKQQIFLGRKNRPKPFNVHGLYQNLIIVKYIEEGSYPMHYVLEKKTLVDGLKKAKK